MVHRHELDRLRAQEPHAVDLSAVQHHLQEAAVVARRREQSRPAGEGDARPVDVVALAEHAVRSALDPAVVLRGVNGGEAGLPRGSQVELGVRQAERTEDSFLEEVGESRPRHLLDHDTQDVGVVPVDVLLARLRVHRKRRHPLDDGRNRLRPVGEVPVLDSRRLPLRRRRAVAIADPRRVGEQVTDGDLALRGHRAHRCLGHRALRRRYRHRRLLERRDVPRDRVGEIRSCPPRRASRRRRS